MQVQQAEWAANRTSELVPSYRETRVFDFARLQFKGVISCLTEGVAP